MLILTSLIDEVGRLRKVKQPHVNELADSINTIGLLNPIVVLKPEAGRYRVVSGSHRLAAVRQLGWSEIPVTVVDLSAPEAIIAECDENLLGPDLSATERVRMELKRKEAYELLNPTAKHGHQKNRGNRHTKAKVESGQNGHSLEPPPPPSYADAAAARRGVSARAVRRNVLIADKLDSEIDELVAGTPLDSQRVLEALARTPKPQQKAKLAEIAAARAVPKPARLPKFTDLKSKSLPKVVPFAPMTQEEKDEAAWNKEMDAVLFSGKPEWRANRVMRGTMV